MTKIEVPSFTHPFYVTADPEYSMAFSTKRHSSTGHEQEGAKIEYAKNGDDTFVYAISLNPQAKFLDIRHFDTSEFNEFQEVLPKGIIKLMTIYADNYKRYRSDKQRHVNQYSGNNDIWYIFELMKGTVIGLLQSDPDSKLFNKRKFLEVLHRSPSSNRYFSKERQRDISNGYAEFCRKNSRDVALQASIDIYGDEQLTQRSSRSIEINKNTKLSEKMDLAIQIYIEDYKDPRLKELYYEIGAAIPKIFEEYKKFKEENPDMWRFSLDEVYSRMSWSMESTYSKIQLDKAFNEIPEDQKRNINARTRMYSDYTYLNADYMNNITFSDTEFGTKGNAIEQVSKEILHDEYLSNLSYDTTTHQLMSHYLEIMSKKGYAGVITAEDDTNDETGSRVFTDFAVGIWDISGVDQASIIPMKLKWLKKIFKKEDGQVKDPNEKIDRYVKLYMQMTKGKTEE